MGLQVIFMTITLTSLLYNFFAPDLILDNQALPQFNPSFIGERPVFVCEV